MSKITITNTRPGGFGIPGGPVIAGNDGSLEVEKKDWDGVKDHPVVKAWLDAGHLKIDGSVEEDDGLDREDLKKQASELGIEFARNIATDKLKELIDAKLAA